MAMHDALKALIFVSLLIKGGAMTIFANFFNRAKLFWQRVIIANAQAHPFWAALMSGFLLPLAYPPFYLLPVFYLTTCLVFFLAVQNLAALSLWQLARLGWCFVLAICQRHGMDWRGVFGRSRIVFMGAALALTDLPAVLALFHAAAFALFGALAKGFLFTPLRALILLALLLTLSEYARSHLLTGLPWNLPVMGWAGWLYLAQPVALIGIYGLSLLILLSAALLASGRRRAVCLAIALPLSTVIYSFFVLADSAIKSDENALIVTIVQPNLPQRENGYPTGATAIEKTEMTALGLQYAPDTDLIWPETAIPAD